MSTQAAARTLTITLTDRAPVKIVRDEWPEIAGTSGDSFTSVDENLHHQALSDGDLDEWSLSVRQHSDGRAIVYGRYMKGWRSEREDWAGGELIEAGEDIAAAIRRVGTGWIPDKSVRDCIARLPAEEI